MSTSGIRGWKMILRKGFKAEAARLAGEVRRELGLDPLERLEPRHLARHLEIPIMTLSDLSDESEDATYLLSEGSAAFSAVTVFKGHGRVIVHNDSHSKSRQNSNLAHELSHALLFHEPTPALDGITGSRIWNPTNEAEADWLAGELLVTPAMALAVARSQLTHPEAMERFRVSSSMLKWRLNMTGSVKRVGYERARWRAG